MTPDTAPVSRPAKAKGAIVRPMVEWFAGACGEAALRDVAADLTPEVRDEIALEAPAFGILPAGWYSEALASQLADAILRHAMPQHSDAVIIKSLGSRIVDRTLGKFSRAAVEWLATPATCAAAGPIFWRMYHDSGEVSASVNGASMHARNIRWAVHSTTWCRVVGASCVRVLELAGVRDPRTWVHKCSGGKGECSMVFRWTA
jgi:hypothetical protein